MSKINKRLLLIYLNQFQELELFEDASPTEIQDYIYKTNNLTKKKIPFQKVQALGKYLINELYLNKTRFRQIVIGNEDVLISTNEKLPNLNLEENMELYRSSSSLLLPRPRFLNEKLKKEAMNVDCDENFKIKYKCKSCSIILDANFTLHLCKQKVCLHVTCFGARCNRKDCNKTSHENFISENEKMTMKNLPQPIWSQIELIEHIRTTDETYNYIFYNSEDELKIVSTLGLIDDCQENIIIKKCFCQKRIMSRHEKSSLDEAKIGCSCFYLIKRNFDIFHKKNNKSFLVCVLVQREMTKFPSNFHFLSNYRKSKLDNCQLIFFIDQTQKENFLTKPPKQLSVYDFE